MPRCAAGIARRLGAKMRRAVDIERAGDRRPPAQAEPWRRSTCRNRSRRQARGFRRARDRARHRRARGSRSGLAAGAPRRQNDFEIPLAASSFRSRGEPCAGGCGDRRTRTRARSLRRLRRRRAARRSGPSGRRVSTSGIACRPALRLRVAAAAGEAAAGLPIGDAWHRPFDALLARAHRGDAARRRSSAAV